MSVTIGSGQSSPFPDASRDGDSADAAATFAALVAQPQPQDRLGGVAGQINAFYQDLLGQDADPRALGDIQDAMASGQSLAQAEAFLRPILTHSDTATAAIDAFYHQGFGRAATLGELGSIEGALASGQSLLGIEAALTRMASRTTRRLAPLTTFTSGCSGATRCRGRWTAS